MECNAVRLLLAFRRPGGPSELAPEDLAAIDQHLAGCPACAAIVAQSARFDAAVASTMRTVSVPVHLKARVLTATLAQQGALWRQAATKGFAAAVAALVVFTIAGGVYWLNRPPFPTEGVADQFSQEMESPEPAVKTWLTEQGLPATLPLDFDYRYHQFHGKAAVDGKDVPVVVFQIWSENQQRIDTARVYVVRSNRFNLAEIKNAQNSFASVEVFHDEKSGVAYVVLYTTPTLKPFLKKMAREAT